MSNTLPDGIRQWSQYENKPCQYTVIAKLYAKNGGELAGKMKRSNLGKVWPAHLKTERNMHYLMQESSGEDHKIMFAKWATNFANDVKDDKPKKKKKGDSILKKNNELFSDTGYQAELKKLETLTARAAEDLRDMLEDGTDSKEISAATNVYNGLTASLHKFKKDSFGIYADDGDYIHITDIINTFLPVISKMKNDLLSECVIISNGLAGIDKSDLIAKELKTMVNLILGDAVNEITGHTKNK